MKNILKALVLVGIYFISLQAVAADLQSYFKDSFEEADQAFEASIKNVEKNHTHTEKYEFNYEQGTIKSLFWPVKDKSNQLLVVISGTHGVEGFTGSAVQRWMLDQDFITNRKNADILFVHGLNVYGMKNKRRVNEANIDLNRNFIVNRADFKIDDDKYGNLNDFLNPTDQAHHGFFSKANFVFSAVVKILKYGLENLRNPILRGQYSYPEGMFYGGKETAPQGKMITELIPKFVKDNYKKIFIIDLHTGYGKKGKLHLMAGSSKDAKENALTTVFNEDELDFGDKKSFYVIQGELIRYFESQITAQAKEPKPTVLGVTYEYGTLDSQTTLGSIESLRRMVFENQNHWHKAASEQDAALIKNDFIEMFNPSDLAWRESILSQTDEKTKKIMNWLEKD